MPKDTSRDSRKTRPQKIQLETHHQQGDGRMSEVGLLLLSKLPTGEADVGGWGREHATSYSDGNPEVSRTPCGAECPPKTTYNHDKCPEQFWSPASDDIIAATTLFCNERRPEASKQPAPCPGPPVASLPSIKGHLEAFQTPCDRRPVITISASEGGVGDSQKHGCDSKDAVHTIHNRETRLEAPTTPELKARRKGTNFCNGTPPESLPKPARGDRPKKISSSNKGHPETSKDTLLVDKRPKNTKSNTKAQPGAFQTARSDKHTISRTQCADKRPNATLFCNEGRPGASGTIQCESKRPTITISSNKGHPEASRKSSQGRSDDRHPMNTSCNEWRTQPSRKPQPVHTSSDNEKCTEKPRKPRSSDRRSVQTFYGNKWCPESTHKLGQRPLASENYTARGETQHMKTTKASPAPQNAAGTTTLTDSGDQTEMCKFRSVPSKFRWIFKHVKFQRDMQRSYMVETSFNETGKGIFIKGRKEDVDACINYLRTMAEQWRQWDK